MKPARKYERWYIDKVTMALLEDSFEQCSMPDMEELSSLACLLNVSVKRVRVWFQNRRQRSKIPPMDNISLSSVSERTFLPIHSVIRSNIEKVLETDDTF